jgi:serine/threonine protein kinase
VVAGRYGLVGELGRGGMGVVWRAEDLVIRRQVALKELRTPPGLPERERATFTERVLREARTAGALNDPGVVTVYDVVAEGESVYLVMELVEAPTLADVVAAEGPLPEHRVAAIGLGAVGALDSAHQAGIVHRDVKPSNIMVLADGRVKLADFGIAQAKDDPSLTVTGGVMGSPGYLAPELFREIAPSPASDLWSLGATLFAAVEGKAPFQRSTTAATLHAIMYDDPRLVRCGGPLASVIMGLLDHNVQTRLTAAQVRDRLRPLAGDRPTATVVLDDRTRALGNLTDRNTELVTRRPSSTAPRPPWDDPFADDSPTEIAAPLVALDGDAWGAEWSSDTPDRSPSRRRRGLLISAAGALVVAVALVAWLVVTPKSTPPAADGGHTNLANQHELGSPTATTVASTTATTATSTTAVPTSSTTSAPPVVPVPPPPHPTSSTAAPAPPPVTTSAPPPPLPLVELKRYHILGGYHWVSTTKYPPPSNYVFESNLGNLVADSQPGAHPVWACQYGGTTDEYVSLSSDCERYSNPKNTTLGLMGYAFIDPPAGYPSIGVYRCVVQSTKGTANPDFFVSTYANCEGQYDDGLIGYLVTK